MFDKFVDLEQVDSIFLLFETLTIKMSIFSIITLYIIVQYYKRKKYMTSNWTSNLITKSDKDK